MRTRWDLMPRRVKRPGMLAGGDGSTLSLDFTAMSSLDSRFTFSRSSPATFINSSGLVKYADHNLFLNTVWTSTTAPTGWLQVSLGGGQDGTFTYNGDGSISFSTGSSQRCLFQPSPAITVANGLTYTIGFEVVSVSGGTTISECLTNNLVTDSFYRNGVSVAGSTVVQAGDILQTVFTSNATSITPRMGLGLGGAVSNKSIRIRTPQMNAGNTAAATLGYIANSSTTAAYHAPRFDYDPTTLAPRGLLIEGSVTNLLNWSESFATSGGTNNNWADTNITRNSTNNIDPAGGTTALRITASAGNGTIISSAAMGTSAERTFSIWLRRVNGTGNIQYTLDNGSTYTTQAITSSWVRYTFAATTAAQRVGIRIVTSGDAIEVWGAQLETGSGASSYIPTGASTVQRAADSCSMTGTNFSSWFNASEGTVFSHHRANEFATATRFVGSLRESDSNYIDILRYSLSSFNPEQFVQSGGTLVAQLSDTGLTSATARKSAAAFKANDFALSVNGRSVITDTSGAVPTANPNTLWVGSYANSLHFNGTIASLKFWPTRLPNATLQSLTQ